MNFGLIVDCLSYAVEHRKELAKDAEIGIHLIRRLEHICVKHSTTADKVLVAAGDALGAIAGDNDGKPIPVPEGTSDIHLSRDELHSDWDDRPVDHQHKPKVSS